MRNFGKNAFYSRDENLPLVSITIRWKVQRYYCKACSTQNFNSFTNTIFNNREQHPVFYLILCIYQLFPLNLRYIRKLIAFLHQLRWNSIADTDETVISVTMEKNHLSDDFVISLRHFLKDCLNEKQRRLACGLFAIFFGNISLIHEITTKARKTIRRGKNELKQQLLYNALNQGIRKPGAGRKSKIAIHQQQVLNFVEEYTAGDPMSRKKWMRITLRKVSDALGNIVSYVSVGKILKDNNYSLLVNKKTKRSRKKHPDRGKQFDYIKQLVQYHESEGNPVIPIDGKKTEKIGASDGRKSNGQRSTIK